MAGLELPAELPIFPLPDVVLFPDTRLPLHMFEPRYRQLASDVIAGDGCFGMVLLRPPVRSDEGDSPVFEVGCAGRVSDVRTLPDGRVNFVLTGELRFRIDQERDTRKLYRIVSPTGIDEPGLEALPPDAGARLSQAREALERNVLDMLSARAGDQLSQVEARLRSLTDDAFVHSLAFGLELPAVEKQSVLECDGLVERAELLQSLVAMRLAETSQPDQPRSMN